MKINEDFKRLIPPLSTEEFAQLEALCVQEGIRDAIVTWNGFIIDGHNRYAIAQKHGLKFTTFEKEFESAIDVRIWMRNNQKGRRNLSKAWVIELELGNKEDLALKGEEIRVEKISHFRQEGETLSQNDNIPKHDTRKEIAKAAGVSTGMIGMSEVVKAKSPELWQKAKDGEITVTTAYQEIKKEEKKANFEQKKQEFEKPIDICNTNQIILHGDSLAVLPTLEKNTFDLLLSDPPYGMDFKSGWSKKNKITNDKIEDTINLFENVLRESLPLLKEDAHFYLFGNIDYISQIRPIIEKHLNLKNILIWDRKVIGMGDLKTYGKSFDIIYFGYNKKWKDLNGTRDRDILSFSRVDPSKNIHPTEKPIDLLEYLIKKSTKENEKVLEPFAGGGSTLLACKNTNRLATGIEIEKNYVQLIKSRI